MLETFPYCPTLYARQAEIKALAQLPAVTKDKLFPLIIARPWPRAKQLNMTWAKIKEALGKHRFALDLDAWSKDSGKCSEAAGEFDSLFETNNGFENYYNAVSKIDEAIPVLRLDGGAEAEFDAQAAHVDQLDRGLVLRIERKSVEDPFELVDRVLERFEDVSVFVDVGWGKDILNREIWASGIIEHISKAHPEIALVVTGSSFPDTFTNIKERGTNRVEERRLYDNLVRRHNAAILIYGDWGSTRPPREPTPMKNTPRIDLPTLGEWISFRRDKDTDDDEDYSDIAQRVIADKEWPADLDIWGTRIIDWTAKGEAVAIRSPVTAAASRINIHLHRQAFFGAPKVANDGDEPFTDD